MAIAGVDLMATPVIINTSSIKNYSLMVPSHSNIKTISSAQDFQIIISGMETITLWNAIKVPLQLLKVILSTDHISPTHLATKILQAMRHLDAKSIETFFITASPDDPEEIPHSKALPIHPKRYVDTAAM